MSRHIHIAGQDIALDSRLGERENRLVAVTATELHELAYGVTGKVPWTKLGYTPTMDATESDIWSYAGVYTFPTVAQEMECVSSDNTNDIGTIIKNGTSTGGSTTSLIDSGANFNAATAVAVGDCVILDKTGTVPEWGYVTAIASNTELTIGNGFSSGGSGSGRSYYVLDKSAKTGAHAVKIDYLDGSYLEKTIIVILNGTTTAVPTVANDIFRVNSFRIIATGTNNKPTGNLSVRHLSDSPVYSYISAGFTRARNMQYTVPYGKNLYIVQFSAAWSVTGGSTKEFVRIYTRANIEPATKFNTGSLFYPYTEVALQNMTVFVTYDIPTMLPPKTDIRVSGKGTVAGSASCVLRGWLETI